IVNWFKKATRFIFRQEYHAKWEGEFYNPDVDNQDAWTAFWEVFYALNGKSDISMVDLIIAQIQIMKESLQYVREHGSVEDLDLGNRCVTCYRNAGVRKAKCNHLLCVPCYTVISNTEEMKSPLNDELVRDLCP